MGTNQEADKHEMYGGSEIPCILDLYGTPIEIRWKHGFHGCREEGGEVEAEIKLF
jgi:hypothetical protein